MSTIGSGPPWRNGLSAKAAGTSGVFVCGPLLLALVVIAGLATVASAQPGRPQVDDGNRLYQERRFDEATKKYEEALEQDPQSQIIQFNLGNAQYKQEDFAKAAEYFRQSVGAEDVRLRSQAYYNLGNSLYRLQQLPDAVAAYEQALKINPDDEDAKYNLEYVRKKLNETPPPPQNQPQGDKKPEQNSEEQKEQEKGQESKPEESESSERQQKENPDDRKSGAGDREQGQEKRGQDRQEQQPEPTTADQAKQPAGISKEEAARILEALKEDQRNLRIAKARAAGRSKVEKDW